jgi:REP element-mobilizing transposase RayT
MLCEAARNGERERVIPSAYLITFVCYGAYLPGTPGAVDRFHNVPGSRKPEPDPEREAAARQRMSDAPYHLDAVRREAVLTAIREVCAHRGWTLLAAHTRTGHVHAVVEACETPERVMNAWKCYASRALNQMKLDHPGRRRWARHGSTRHLWNSDAVSRAIHYVVCEQGERMSVFEVES